MPDIKFTADEKAIIVGKIQLYFAEELKQKLGRFEAEFLLDFVAEELGAYFYNRGLYDAQAVLASKIDDVQDSIFQLEQKTAFKR
jgi:uncharacterized protein (DUF2164 family)